jgi:hypothetical protein
MIGCTRRGVETNGREADFQRTLRARLAIESANCLRSVMSRPTLGNEIAHVRCLMQAAVGSLVRTLGALQTANQIMDEAPYLEPAPQQTLTGSIQCKGPSKLHYQCSEAEQRHHLPAEAKVMRLGGVHNFEPLYFVLCSVG